MTAIVRLFTYHTLISAPVSPVGGRLSTDSVSQLKQPYLAREKLTIADSSQTSAAATAPSGTKLLMVQVQEGKTVNYEISPANDSTPTDADQSSPTLTGDQVFHFGEGWRIAFIENGDA